jgi:hypothetical protein
LELTSPESTYLIFPVDNEKSSENFSHYKLVIPRPPDKEMAVKKRSIKGDGYMGIRDLLPDEYFMLASRIFYRKTGKAASSTIFLQET